MNTCVTVGFELQSFYGIWFGRVSLYFTQTQTCKNLGNKNINENHFYPHSF